MFDTFLSIISIYSFILIGFFAKKRLKDELHEKSLSLVSIYLLQPIMVFWGLSSKPIDLELLYTPFIYFVILCITLLIIYPFRLLLFEDKKDRAIFSVSALIPNTGNLGIPLGIALFGNDSVVYTNITNLANLFFMYIFGVILYSSGDSNIQTSIKNVFKIPVMWFAILAIAVNLLGISINPIIYKTFEMGAYASIVVQLIIFGVYLSEVKIGEINYKLLLYVLKIKFLILPLITILLLSFFDINSYIKAIIFMQMVIPMAVNNVNLSALYDCKPSEVTTLVFVSSILFMGLIFIYAYVVDSLYLVTR